MGFVTVPPSPFPPSSGKTGDIAERVTELETNVSTLQSTKAPKTDIAPAFSAETNYSVGDLVYYDGALYECTTEHTAGVWNSEHFTDTAIDDQLNAINSNLNAKPYRLAGEYGTTDDNQNAVLHFAGKAFTRSCNYVLYVSGQGSIIPPIHIGFTGSIGGVKESITGIITDTLPSGVSISGTDLIVNCALGGGWGVMRLYGLIGGDDIAITVDYVNK